MSIDLKGKAVKHLLLPTVSYESSTIKIISAQQGDSQSRYFSVQLYDDGGTIDVTGYSNVTLNATLPDETKELYAGEIDSTRNRAICPLPSDILCQEGRVACDICFWTGENDDKVVLTSQTFYVMVLPSQASEDAIIAQDKSGLLADIVVNEQNRIEAENARQAAEQERADTESTRNSNEEARKSDESDRANAETQRESAETNREAAETGRSKAEDTRVAAENTRGTNEASRETAEASRVSAEEKRVAAEKGRVDAESKRDTAEAGRASAETARVSAEKTRDSNETTRKNNESARETAESKRATAESDRATAESARASAEQTRVSAENTRKSQETARQNAEIERSSAFDTLKSNAETATKNANDAAKAANDATKTANDAAQAASDVTITSEVIEYQLTDTGTLPETGWATNMPSPVQGKYFWTKVTTTYGNKTTKVRVSVAYCGTDGETPVSASINDNGELVISWE